MRPITIGAAAVLAAMLATHAQAAMIVDLNPLDADVAYASGDATGVNAPGAVRSNGHTVNATIVPTASDLNGSVVVMEYGGTSNGFNLGLVDGVLTYTAKHNSGDHLWPDSINDTSLRPDGASSGEASVQSSAGALVAGVEYTLAASWDQQGSLWLGVSDSFGVVRDHITITGEYDNWSGNNTLGIGSGYMSYGGYSGELGGNTAPSPFDVDETPVKSFAGTISDLHYWNAAGAIVPEPVSPVLAMLGVLVGAPYRFRW